MSEKKHKRSKAEIAKQFDLPERKSKIATIMRQDDQAYCICRTSDSSRFMIGCDGCEEWYHGDCISISEKEAKHIKHYYCLRCRQEDQTLQIVFRAVPTQAPASGSSQSTTTTITTSTGTAEVPEKKLKPPKKERTVTGGSSTSGSSTKRCGFCAGCSAPKCGRCEPCHSRKGRCEMRVCVNHSTTVASRPKRRRSPSPEPLINPALEGQRQCYGPACKMTARPQSKYCSDECGLKLATNRIFQVLPQRIQEWNLVPCVADEKSKQQLESNRRKQAQVRSTLQDLDKGSADLDALVERAQHSSIDPRASENAEVEDETSMYCITCGHEIHSKTAIRHMEKCFNKYESQASFGSIFKTRIEGGSSMFCDYYNSNNKTYCKRLRVLCPEHSKDPKVNDSDVCGCPLVTNVFQRTGDFCRAPKKSCFRHYVWEKIRRAEIDLERVRQWLKLDELVEQERQIRSAMANRNGVLGLMLHSTRPVSS